MPNGTILHDLVFAQRGIKYLKIVDNMDMEKVTTTDILSEHDLNHGNAHNSIKQLTEEGYLERELVNGEKPIELTEKGKKVLEIFDA